MSKDKRLVYLKDKQMYIWVRSAEFETISKEVEEYPPKLDIVTIIIKWFVFFFVPMFLIIANYLII